MVRDEERGHAKDVCRPGRNLGDLQGSSESLNVAVTVDINTILPDLSKTLEILLDYYS